MLGKGTKQLHLNSSYFQLQNDQQLISSIFHSNQKLLTAESSAGTLIRYRCQYSGQFEINSVISEKAKTLISVISCAGTSLLSNNS